MTRGLEAGEPVRVSPVSVADGLGAPSAGRLALDVVQRYVDDVVLIDDPTILAGLRFGVERLKQVLEPAGVGRARGGADGRRSRCGPATGCA